MGVALVVMAVVATVISLWFLAVLVQVPSGSLTHPSLGFRVPVSVGWTG